MTQLQDLAARAAGPSQPAEHTMKLKDGAELFYRAWVPEGATDKALVLFHRGHEHSGRWQETVAALALEDVAVFAWDARGHGRSPGERGSAKDLATVIQDIDTFVHFLSERHGIALENMIVLAHSVGAVTAAAWVHDYAPPLRGLILATPAFRVKLYVPFAVPFLRLRQKLLGPGYVKSYVKASMLTHDPLEAERYQADKLIFRQIAVNILLDLHDTSTRLLADAGAITVPTLMLVAGSDWVVKGSAQQQFFDRLSSPVKQMEVLPGFYHAIFHEKNRAQVIDKVRAFIDDCFRQPPRRVSLLDADKNGYTKAEYDRLCKPGGISFAVTRAMMKTVGRLSHGVQLGWRAGFDSGMTLDYVYENRPQGITFLGRMIDRSYLNSLGWRGIRLRRIHLEQVLRAAIEKTHAAGGPVRLLDIASGPGRYVLETMRQLAHIPMTAMLRDYKEENLAAARRLAQELGLTNVALVHGDAFDRGSLASVMPRPTIAIVSGLYELFPDNEPVLRSLRGLADALEPGGHLIYTGQPWHPQVEFIARVLTNREGKPWIMRRRTQAEMDDLVHVAGFEKLSQEIDPGGIFTVSVARRVGA
ncbi:MAG TPA: bifunctional alpha/beta hydrolase/class I SAM-dependent methyltransferase [Gemmataceae bacterium]|jgi:alpha-beta hydrolase superfamily lysophospholipase/SAM-dependent methyltransferase|nr:bifunctional alpha/beta hydrolase/class I SAM-dependent methyltransferase [Gemmataceae bacterium]